jgi:putative N6-adenine-specific DNA methylase
VVRLLRDQVTISADTSGELLHRRGYRLAGGKAPLRETLAAAILLGARYDGSEALMDPFAGSGTIPIEGALIARRIAPGLAREFAIERWPGFDGAAGKARRAGLTERIRPSATHPIAGFDRDEGALEAARENARRAGVREDIAWTVAPLSSATPPASGGLLASNPPYGVRIGERESLRDLYAALGALLRGRWKGWRAALLSADRRLTGHLELALAEPWHSTNGGLPVTLVTSP